MSEHMAAEIWIGGPVSQSLVPELCKVIAESGAEQDWGEGEFCPTSADDLRQAVRETDEGVQVLWLCDDQARWGRFEHLEMFLWEHQIAFSRQSAGRWEYDPERVEFRPGRGTISRLTNAAGQPVVLAEKLLPIKNLLRTATELSQKGSPDAWSSVETAVRLLHEELSADLPPLEPFTIKPE